MHPRCRNDPSASPAEGARKTSPGSFVRGRLAAAAMRWTMRSPGTVPLGPSLISRRPWISETVRFGLALAPGRSFLLMLNWGLHGTNGLVRVSARSPGSDPWAFVLSKTGKLRQLSVAVRPDVGAWSREGDPFPRTCGPPSRKPNRPTEERSEVQSRPGYGASRIPVLCRGDR